MAALVSTVMFLPQVVRTWRQRRNAEELAGVSIVTFALVVANSSLWLAYGVLREDAQMIATNILVGLTAVATIWIVVHGRAAADARELAELLDDADLVRQ